jgi:hypothetical protein
MGGTRITLAVQRSLSRVPRIRFLSSDLLVLSTEEGQKYLRQRTISGRCWADDGVFFRGWADGGRSLVGSSFRTVYPWVFLEIILRFVVRRGPFW